MGDGSQLVSAALAIAMLGVAALLVGGLSLVRRESDRKRGLLMLVAALVLFVNVLLLSWPVKRSPAPPRPLPVPATQAR